MKYILVILTLSLSFIGVAKQSNDSVIIEEINQTLWKPFKKAWETNNHQLFNSLHTDDVFRVNSWGIKVGDEYKESNEKSMSDKSSGDKTINFSIEHRIYSGNNGYEVGYYKISNGPTDYYAQFHVRLRKEDGQWKICQDWDTGNINGVKFKAEDFEKNKMLDLGY